MAVQGPLAAKPLRVKAQRLEREGDLAGAFEAYQQAAALSPSDPELLSALADLAGRLEMHDVAVSLWSHLLRAAPDDVGAQLGQARALVAAGRFADAVEALQQALPVHPGEPRLWTTLGLALTYAGRAEEAITFFDEAVRLDASLPGGLYNRGLAWCDLGRLEAAAADFAAAAKAARKGPERATIEFSRATVALAQGELADGWALYEQRLSPDWPRSVSFTGPGKRLGAAEALAGRRVLALAEQGIGDEIMFAGLLPDLIQEVGAEGRVVVAVEPRLVSLFQRSFPQAEVLAHATRRLGARMQRLAGEGLSGRIDLWTPLASLAGRYRPRVESFPQTAYLAPDPERVAHWRRWLGEGPPAVGLTWRSGKLTSERRRFYPELGDWAALLRTQGLRFVNLQYGECGEELAELSRIAGAPIAEPPGLDIKDDMEGLAALIAALGAVVSVQNATGALAGAVGAPTFVVAGPGSWTPLGEDRLPWYAEAPLFTAGRFGQWSPAIAEAAEAVRARLGA